MSTVVVVQQPSPETMDRSNYAGDFTLARFQIDSTSCGKQKLDHNGEDFLVYKMASNKFACCFWQEHPDLVIKSLDIGEISPMPPREKTWVCCYCCCLEQSFIGPNHDLRIAEDECLCYKERYECNVGEAEAMNKINGTWMCCDFQKPDHATCCQCNTRKDTQCMFQEKSECSCDWTCHTCCKGQSKLFCCVNRFALPCDDDVPLGCGCCGFMLCGGESPSEEQPQGQTTVVVV